MRNGLRIRCKFRDVGVLPLDNIQFLARKERTQKELFYTFDALYELSKQIVVMADRPPGKITNLNAHLKGRFQYCLSVWVDVPEHETKLDFIRRKATTLIVQLPKAVVQLLASGKPYFRELEGSRLSLHPLFFFTW